VTARGKRAVIASQRVGGCAPDDRLREAIYLATQKMNGLLRRYRSSQ
jgi:hypothetical protein